MFCKLERINNFKMKYLYRDQELSIFQEENPYFSYNGVKSRPILMNNSSHLFFFLVVFGGLEWLGPHCFLWSTFSIFMCFLSSLIAFISINCRIILHLLRTVCSCKIFMAFQNGDIHIQMYSYDNYWKYIQRISISFFIYPLKLLLAIVVYTYTSDYEKLWF